MPTPKLCSAKTNKRAAILSISSTPQAMPNWNLARRPITATSTTQTITPRKLTSSASISTTIRRTTTTIIPTIPTPMTPRKSKSSVSRVTIPFTATSTIPTLPKLVIPQKSKLKPLSKITISSTTIPTKKLLSKITTTTTPRLPQSAASTPREKRDVKIIRSMTLTASKTKFSSPFKSFVTSGLRMRSRTKSTDFDYDLSNDERLFMGFKSPMKAVPDGQRELLKSGQRGAYLAQRYEYSPDHKYNFPEATSWRIGWLHNCQTKQQCS